jgi:hypothetical protein
VVNFEQLGWLERLALGVFDDFGRIRTHPSGCILGAGGRQLKIELD